MRAPAATGRAFVQPAVVAALLLVVVLLLGHDVVLLFGRDVSRGSYGGASHGVHSATSVSTATPPVAAVTTAANYGRVCIVIRASQRDFGGDFALPVLLRHLHATEYPAWTALVVPADNSTMPELGAVLRLHGGGRARAVAPPARMLRPWDLDHAGYEPTDFAVTQCPADAVWLLVTNADNWYHRSLFTHLAPPAADVIAYDFLTRHVYLFGDLRFPDAHLTDHASSDGRRGMPVDPCATTASVCVPNGFVLANSDLGSVVYNLTRFRAENRRFAVYPGGGCGCQDGLMMNDLRAANWTIRHVRRCLYSHNTNAWSQCRSRHGLSFM